MVGLGTARAVEELSSRSVTYSTGSVPRFLMWGNRASFCQCGRDIVYVSRLVSGEGTEQEGEGLTLVEQKRQYQSPFGMVVSLGCGGRERQDEGRDK